MNMRIESHHVLSSNTNILHCHAEFSASLRPVIMELALPSEMRFSSFVEYRILRNLGINKYHSI
jgi:hypothetical protein